MRNEGWSMGEGRMESALDELESALGHSFSRPELLVCALTHRSLAHELAQSDGGNHPSALEAAEILGLRATPGWRQGKQRAPGISWRRGVGPGGGRGALCRASGMARGRAHPHSFRPGKPRAHGAGGGDDRAGQASAPEPRRRAQRPAPQEHGALQYHGSSDGRALSRWRSGTGARLLCAAR